SGGCLVHDVGLPVPTAHAPREQDLCPHLRVDLRCGGTHHDQSCVGGRPYWRATVPVQTLREEPHHRSDGQSVARARRCRMEMKQGVCEAPMRLSAHCCALRAGHRGAHELSDGTEYFTSEFDSMDRYNV